MFLWMHALALCSALAAPPDRAVMSLDGAWEITTDDPTSADTKWRAAMVPGTFEDALGIQFDGIATYRKTFTIPADFSYGKLLLHFDAAATFAQVWLNDQFVGEHLGAWTPFRCDVSACAKRGGENVLTVLLDERVGHNTQGFLPIIEPHFGGLWRSVQLIGAWEPYLDDLSLLALGDSQTGLLDVEAPLVGDPTGYSVTAEIEINGKTFSADVTDGQRHSIQVEGFEPWDFDKPKLYPVRFTLKDKDGIAKDRAVVSTGFRSFGIEGRAFGVDGRPFVVRGILDWGYWPPGLAPDPPDAVIDAEIAEAKARGFNLIKFCLWSPSERILSRLDAAGMLAWIEYPTWHPKLDADHRDELTLEFDELFLHDRNHPCVALRSLTCETGASASLDVVTELYERAHARIPGAIVEDDSSWIAWNRVHDFWDDHPYGNNDDWPARLDALNGYVDQHGDLPLFLGEAIAADTWLDRTQLPGKPGDWFRPLHEQAQADWEERVKARFGPDVLAPFKANSFRFALNERKDQIEQFRGIVPEGGYVVSVARDFRQAQMGLADHVNHWKWSPEDWRWHGATMLLLERDTARSLEAGATASLAIGIAHAGAEPLAAGALAWKFGEQEGAIVVPEQAVGALDSPGSITITAPKVDRPTPVDLSVALTCGDTHAVNRWTFWVVPALPRADGDVEMATVLDADRLARIEKGARVLLSCTDEPFSFVRDRHWLLTGSPWFPPSAATKDIPPEFFLDLLVKDLHPTGLIPGAPLFDSVDPIVAFWETHDLSVLKDGLFAFQVGIGDGRLLVTSLPTDGSAAARFLTETFRRALLGDEPPKSRMSDAMQDAIRDRLAAHTMDLTTLDWLFRPDSKDGDFYSWTLIRIGRSWESQNFGTLDGWATYRLDVHVPREWEGESLFANFEGVDDAYEVTFDDQKVGGGGDIENKKTAFDEKQSIRLTEHVTPGSHRLEVRVFDWYGAGGIHRPVTLSTRPLGPAAEFLRAR